MFQGETTTAEDKQQRTNIWTDDEVWTVKTDDRETDDRQTGDRQTDDGETDDEDTDDGESDVDESHTSSL